MRTLFITLVGASLFFTSCGIIDLAALAQGAYGYGYGSQPGTSVPGTGATTPGAPGAGGVIGSMFAPDPDSLTATEDRGTGLYGYLNSYGTWAIAPTYSYAYNFTSSGLAPVQLRNGHWGAINTLGQTVINFTFTSSSDVYSAIRSMENGRYQGIDLWVMQDPNSNLYGYVDYYGNWHLQPRYKYAYSMSDDGVAVVQFTNNRWGAIDRSGNIVVQPNFNSSSDVYSALRNLRR